MVVELWDDKAANLIDEFANEADALAVVREIVLRDGKEAVSSWALDRYEGKPMFRGQALIDRALGRVPA